MKENKVFLDSCACSENRNKSRQRNTTHSLSKTRIYNIFKGMKYRCNGKNCPAYPNYGGRGIRVEWTSFEDFYKDMNNDYEEHVKRYGEKNTSINRVDNDGNYSKENCKWARRQLQSWNRRSSRIIKYNGESLPVTEWSRRIGVKRQTLEKRLNSGWSLEKALTF